MTNSKLQNWALIAELTSGAAVVLSLVFLAVEIRSNTNAVKIDTYDQLVADAADWQMLIATDNELGEATRVRSSEGSDMLNEYQTFISERSGQSLYIIYERAFLQWDAGNITDVQFDRFRTQMCGNRGPRSGSTLDEALRRNTSRSFTEFRDRCREN